ncbi:hypothetical protein D8J80_08000, partial [Campylobacter upsaliensis]|nr:hypothetical protein [Campylobacter upsaliensis]
LVCKTYEARKISVKFPNFKPIKQESPFKIKYNAIFFIFYKIFLTFFVFFTRITFLICSGLAQR